MFILPVVIVVVVANDFVNSLQQKQSEEKKEIEINCKLIYRAKIKNFYIAELHLNSI